MFSRLAKRKRKIFLTKKEKDNDLLSKMGAEDVDMMYETMSRIISHFEPKSNNITLLKEDDMCIAYIKDEKKAIINAQDLINYLNDK